MSRITRRQYEKLLWEWEKTGKVEITAMKAGIDRKTARKWVTAKITDRELREKYLR